MKPSFWETEDDGFICSLHTTQNNFLLVKSIKLDSPYCTVGWSDLAFFGKNKNRQALIVSKCHGNENFGLKLVQKVKVNVSRPQKLGKGHELFTNQKTWIKQWKLAQLYYFIWRTISKKYSLKNIVHWIYKKNPKDPVIFLCQTFQFLTLSVFFGKFSLTWQFFI